MASLFPTSLDTTTSLFTAVNGGQTQLNGFHNSSVSTITVQDTTGAPANGYALIEGEAVLYTAKTATQLTGCTRHADGTAAASHNDKTIVKFGLAADHHNSVVQAIIALETKIGNGATGIDGAKMKDASIPASKLITSAADTGSFKVRVHRLAALAFGAGVWTRVPVDTLDGSDPNTMFDTVGKKIVCKKAGRYSVKGSMTILYGTGTGQVLVSVYKNGSEVSRGNQLPTITTAQTPSVPFSDDIDLAVNDYLDVYVNCGIASNIWTAGNTGMFNYLAVALLP